MEFPQNIIDVLAVRLAAVDGVTAVYDRPLDPTDPNGSLGVSFEMWSGDESSFEIGNRHGDPTLGNYFIQIEHLVKHMSRTDGIQLHRSVARSVRSMLDRDDETVQALRELFHQAPNYRERMMRWTLEQRFAENPINKVFYFVSATTVTFTTETV